MSYAILIDAGYLFAESGHSLVGRHVPRRTMHIDGPALSQACAAWGAAITGSDMYRTYWYDATMPHQSAHEIHEVERMTNTIARLGYTGVSGEQKCVDTQILADMFELAHYHTVTDIILCTGDDDIRPGVELVQRMGIKVHLIGITPSHGAVNQAAALVRAADTSVNLSRDDIERFIRHTPEDGQPMSITPATPTGDKDLRIAHIESFVKGCTKARLIDIRQTLAECGPSIPPHIDRIIIAIGRQVHNRAELSGSERAILRTAFRRYMQKLQIQA